MSHSYRLPQDGTTVTICVPKLETDVSTGALVLNTGKLLCTSNHSFSAVSSRTRGSTGLWIDKAVKRMEEAPLSPRRDGWEEQGSETCGSAGVYLCVLFRLFVSMMPIS